MHDERDRRSPGPGKKAREEVSRAQRACGEDERAEEVSGTEAAERIPRRRGSAGRRRPSLGFHAERVTGIEPGFRNMSLMEVSPCLIREHISGCTLEYIDLYHCTISPMPIWYILNHPKNRDIPLSE
jgi:hypothetical protein